jgi:hypothetical protein
MGQPTRIKVFVKYLGIGGVGRGFVASDALAFTSTGGAPAVFANSEGLNERASSGNASRPLRLIHPGGGLSSAKLAEASSSEDGPSKRAFVIESVRSVTSSGTSTFTASGGPPESTSTGEAEIAPA